MDFAKILKIFSIIGLLADTLARFLKKGEKTDETQTAEENSQSKSI